MLVYTVWIPCYIKGQRSHHRVSRKVLWFIFKSFRFTRCNISRWSNPPPSVMLCLQVISILFMRDKTAAAEPGWRRLGSAIDDKNHVRHMATNLYSVGSIPGSTASAKRIKHELLPFHKMPQQREENKKGNNSLQITQPAAEWMWIPTVTLLFPEG